jgi:hypothetical protein
MKKKTIFVLLLSFLSFLLSVNACMNQYGTEQKFEEFAMRQGYSKL